MTTSFTTATTTSSNSHFKTTINQQKGPYIQFNKCLDVQQWLDSQPGSTGEWKTTFEKQGYLVIPNLLDERDLEVYSRLYSQFISGEIDAGAHRHDLGSNEPRKLASDENVCQIMWPSDYVRIAHGPLHQRTHAVSKLLLGEEISFDFDMLIYKAPFTSTDVPWHQDEGYWPDMPDKRAVSCWVAIDNVTIDNGCMWFLPGSHKLPLRKHIPAKPGSHVLVAQNDDDLLANSSAVAVPLSAGGCTFHGGRMLHYTKGNSTSTPRRAFISNYRPQSMVEWERNYGFSHGRESLDNINHSSLEVYKDSSGQTNIQLKTKQE